MQRITSDEFQRTLGRYLNPRLDTPLIITCDGEDRLVVLSFEGYEQLRRRDRRAIRVEELSDTQLEAIRCAEPPAEAAQYDHEWPTERGEDV